MTLPADARTAVLFPLLDALVAACTAAVPPDVRVFDGPATDYTLDAYLCIGVDDPDAVRPANAVSSEQTWPNASGRSRDETGEIECMAFAASGGQMKDARVQVERILAAVQTVLRTDVTVGVPGVRWMSFRRQDLRQASPDTGPECLCVFTIYYEARL